MRIVLVPNVYWPQYGGVVTSTDNVTRWFAELGHRVAVIAHRAEPGFSPHETRRGVEVFRLHFSARARWLRPLTFLVALVRMWAILRRFRPDVVHAQFLHINALYLILLSYVLPFRLVLRACGNDIHRFPAESRFFRFLLAWGFRRADQLQFSSNSLLDDARPYLSAARGDVVVVGDGATPEEFEDAPPFYLDGAPFLFAMGRFVEKKGFDLLIEAFARIAPERPDLRVVIGGDGEEMPRLRDLVATRGLEECVRFTGPLDRSAVGGYLKGCRLFVLPSRVEPVGIVVVEAMSLAKPVLATRVGGVPDLIEHQRSGWLVDPTVEALAEGIEHLLDRPDLAADLGERGRERMRARFTWRHIAEEYLAAYRRVLLENVGGA